MDRSGKIFVAGHRGLVGSACVRLLEKRGFTNILMRTRQELDLQNRAAVEEFYKTQQPRYVIFAAAKVGGILANNTYPVEFLLENLEIQNNLIRGAYENKVEKLLFLGSSCIYPKFAPQPITEDALLTGTLEPTNEPYALAKIAGIKLCQAYHREYDAHFLSAMPTNLYGPNDNFDLQTSHVLPALIRRFHEAKTRKDASVTLWGTGSPKREFLHVDDLAEACLFLLEKYDESEIINVGFGQDCSIRELAETIQEIVGFTGKIQWDTSKPDGTPRKLLNVDKINKLGWKAKISLEDGIRQTYQWWTNSFKN
jgi:GDP-L-fucose synthase